MSDTASHLVAAAALGFALGAAPGPVQLLILSQTARLGLAGGLRVMLGANGTLFVVMAILALGFSSADPSEATLDLLRVAGGAFLVYLGVVEVRTVLRDGRRLDDEDVLPADGRRRLGPTSLGVVSVILNPGAWIFFGTTAATIVADAGADGGRDAALWAAVATTVGVSASDMLFTVLGSGGRRVLGERRLGLVRIALALGLVGIGVAFVVQGLVR